MNILRDQVMRSVLDFCGKTGAVQFLIIRWAFTFAAYSPYGHGALTFAASGPLNWMRMVLAERK
jgi:hypothetical protein